MNTRRITWIDVAKGITIITMIVGHIVPFGSSLRNLIFSFHMPLFFILSGMTIKVPVSVGELFTFVKKD